MKDKTVKKQKPVTDEIASLERDIFQVPIGKIWPNPDKTLLSESGGRGLEIYEDLLRDPQVRSNLQTRKLAVVGREWEVLPATDKKQDVKVAEFVKEVLLNFNYDASRQALLSGIVLGFKPAEVMWEYSEGDVWVKDIIGRSSRRFVFGKKRELRLLTYQNMIEGEELPDKKFIVFRNISDNGSPYGDGLGSSLYWPVWFKKNAIKFWMIFADKFGSPTAVGKYPAGTTKDQQDALLRALEAIQQESAIKIPDTMMIELLEAARQGSINTYHDLCNFMNADISKVLLGQTLTTEVGDKGSYAASKTHNDVRQDYIKADADALCETQNNSLIKWIVDYNFPDVKKYPKVWIRTDEEEDLKPLAERDEILITKIGLPVSKKYLYDTYGIPQPKERDELVETSSPDSGSWTEGAAGVGPEFAEAGQRHTVSTIVDRLDKEAKMEDLWQPIEKLMENAESMEELRDRLIDIYPEMKERELGNIIQRALTVAELAGRFEVKRKNV